MKAIRRVTEKEVKEKGEERHGERMKDKRGRMNFKCSPCAQCR
jgi:hypothetical protein